MDAKYTLAGRRRKRRAQLAEEKRWASKSGPVYSTFRDPQEGHVKISVVVDKKHVAEVEIRDDSGPEDIARALEDLHRMAKKTLNDE